MSPSLWTRHPVIDHVGHVVYRGAPLGLTLGTRVRLLQVLEMCIPVGFHGATHILKVSN